MSGSPNRAISEAAQRYASALFDLANDAKKVDAIEADAKSLLNAWDQSAELRAVMISPLVQAEDKANALASMAKKMKLSPITANFLGVIAANRRTFELDGMLRGYVALAAKARGAVVAEVSTAEELSEAQLEELKAALGRAFKAPVDIETVVKPELLGGLVVKVGSRLFDDSVKSKLDALKIAMKGA